MSTETITQAAQRKVDALAEGDVDSKDTDVRYMAYASRLRTALRASTRYIAYTSDIGEAFRPVVNPRIVTAAYGISWVYLVGDVSYEAYKAHRRGPTPLEATHFSEPTRIGLVAVERGVFQAIASMGLPALTIHTVVSQTSKIYAKHAKSVKVKAWGPTLTGLAVVPVLPYLFDKPVEHATDFAFGWMKRQWYENAPPSSASKNKEL
ncbi:mitochondrial 18 KDa protein-domain-containing protein [Hysterangium stoloniferum]|nr:mitochondrial 18 KDa protein-domain-containing protein [Hysterangium stoloniferum]